MAKEIGQTIYQQIGHRAFVMMGATNIMLREDGLQWKVGKNSKKVTHITVTLDNNDTYTVKFQKVRGCKVTALAKAEAVCVEDLRMVIESNTNLYLSL